MTESDKKIMMDKFEELKKVVGENEKAIAEIHFYEEKEHGYKYADTMKKIRQDELMALIQPAITSVDKMMAEKYKWETIQWDKKNSQKK